MEYILFLWLGLSIIIGIAASSRYRRGGFGWFLVSILISPLLGGLLLLALGENKRKVAAEAETARTEAARKNTFEGQVARGQLIGLSRTCPHCEHTMSATAPVCGTCHRESEPSMTRQELQQKFANAKLEYQQNRVLKIGLVLVGIAVVIAFKSFG
jgi:hypothetical protein